METATLQRPEAMGQLFAKLCERHPDLLAHLERKLTDDAKEAEAPYPPLGKVTSPAVPTEQAAHYLNRRSQTLRGWACKEDGPLRPVRINGRLAWKVADLRQLLGVA